MTDRHARPLLLMAKVLCLASAIQAQEVDLSGDWRGEIAVPGGLEIVLTFTATDDGWTGVIDIPAQGTADMALGPIEVVGDSVRFALPGPPGEPRFAGVLSADGATLSGAFTQGGAELTFSVARVDAESEAAALDAKLEQLTTLIDTMRTAWDVPGLGISVVWQGEVVYSRGFGQRDVENDLPVTENTLFAIGSTTKAMTSLCIAMLADEGRVDWDERVREYLPEFELMDPVLTDRMTVRDLVTHRSGLPRHDALWYGTPHDRPELVRRLRYLEASRDLRQTFQYNNLLYATAGYLVGRVTDSTWEGFMRQRLFEPLGMDGSNFSVVTSQETDDFALPYAEVGGEVIAIPFRNLDAVGPAGSVNSSAADMARWVSLQLDGGMAGNRRLISQAGLQDTRQAHTVMPSQPNPNGISHLSYGLGWMVHSYRGHFRLEHGGGIDGFTTSVSVLPQDGLGIAVMANRSGTPVPSLVAQHATDLLLDLEPIDWHGQAMAAGSGPGDPEDASIAGTKPAHRLEDYRGDYEHPGYGVITVRTEDDGLAIQYYDVTGTLEHYHYETFRVVDTVPTAEGTKFTFHTDATGEVAWLAVPLEPLVDDIEFVHKPVVQEHVVMRASGPIEVDGRLDDGAWKKAPWTDDFVVHDTGIDPARARMLWTDTHLYLAWQIEDRNLVAEVTDHDGRVYLEDSVELFVDADGDGRNYLQAVVSALGTVMDAAVMSAGGFGRNSDVEWTWEELEIGVVADGSVGDSSDMDKGWTCELAVPFGSIGAAPNAGGTWRLNLTRTDRNIDGEADTVVHTAWSKTDERGYHAPDRFGKILFSDEVAR
jgi:CubicO group peptidase (beta-lactamase class C family)